MAALTMQADIQLLLLLLLLVLLRSGNQRL
jgi:hypothetical protein